MTSPGPTPQQSTAFDCQAFRGLLQIDPYPLLYFSHPGYFFLLRRRKRHSISSHISRNDVQFRNNFRFRSLPRRARETTNKLMDAWVSCVWSSNGGTFILTSCLSWSMMVTSGGGGVEMHSSNRCCVMRVKRGEDGEEMALPCFPLIPRSETLVLSEGEGGVSSKKLYTCFEIQGLFYFMESFVHCYEKNRGESIPPPPFFFFFDIYNGV